MYKYHRDLFVLSNHNIFFSVIFMVQPRASDGAISILIELDIPEVNFAIN